MGASPRQPAGEGAGVAPDVHVRVHVQTGPPARVLVRRAEGAALLVVGSHSRSRLVGPRRLPARPADTRGRSSGAAVPDT
jgi:hypothetical protein